MRIRKFSSRRFKRVSLFGLVLLSLVVAVSVGTGIPSPRTHTAQEKPLQVHNKTASVEIVSAAKEKDTVRVSLRNNSGKFIDGLQARVGSVTVQTEFAGSGVTFPPGAIHEEVYPGQRDVDQRGFTVLCVVFEDDSADGEPKYVKQIKDKRYGARLQTQRALSLIDDLLASAEADTPAGLEKLEAQTSSLPEQHEGAANDDILLGLKDGKASIIHQIQTVQRKQQARRAVKVSEELTSLKQQFARSIKN